MQIRSHELIGIGQGIEPQFLEFWKAFPKKKKKGDAYKAWVQTVAARPALEVVLKAIASQKKSAEWTKEDGKYIPHPGSWLRAWGWEDSVFVDTDMALCAKCRLPLNGGYTSTDEGRVCSTCWRKYASAG